MKIQIQKTKPSSFFPLVNLLLMSNTYFRYDLIYKRAKTQSDVPLNTERL